MDARRACITDTSPWVVFIHSAVSCIKQARSCIVLETLGGKPTIQSMLPLSVSRQLLSNNLEPVDITNGELAEKVR